MSQFAFSAVVTPSRVPRECTLEGTKAKVKYGEIDQKPRHLNFWASNNKSDSLFAEIHSELALTLGGHML